MSHFHMHATRGVKRRPRTHPPAWDIWASVGLMILATGLAVIQFPWLIIPHVIVGLVLGLVAPGYFTVAGLFPQAEDLQAFERWGLVLVLSAIWIIILTLLMSLAHVPLTALNLTIALSLAVLLMGLGAHWQRQNHADAATTMWPHSKTAWITLSSIAALIIITTVVVTYSYTSTSIAFSVTGQHGNLSGYPFKIAQGAKFPVFLSVSNPTSLSSTVTVVARTPHHTWLKERVFLKPGGTWHHKVFLSSAHPAVNQKETFLLYRGPLSSHPIRTLWIRYGVTP